MKIPEKPTPGMVISYAYLWSHEHDKGAEEGAKDRPCAIVSAVSIEEDGKTVVTIVPITHTAPRTPEIAVEMPLKVKKHLGLDGERSWIICDETNKFRWPGPDLRSISRDQREECVYGTLPKDLFDVTKKKVQFCARGRVLKLVQRTE